MAGANLVGANLEGLIWEGLIWLVTDWSRGSPHVDNLPISIALLNKLRVAELSITFCKDGDDKQQKGRQSLKIFFNFAQNSQKRPAFNSKHSKLIIFYL